VCDVICKEAVPFRPYCAGVATRTRNVSEYMLVLALCLVAVFAGIVVAKGASLTCDLRQCSHLVFLIVVYLCISTNIYRRYFVCRSQFSVPGFSYIFMCICIPVADISIFAITYNYQCMILQGMRTW